MYPRYLTPRLERALGRSPVVYLTGARQVGKTTLAHSISAAEHSHLAGLDTPRARFYDAITGHTITSLKNTATPAC